MRYLVKLRQSVTEARVQFQEVSKEVFQQRRKAVNDDDSPKFDADQYVIVLPSGGFIKELHVNEMKRDDFSYLVRALGVTIPVGTNNFIVEAGTIKINWHGATQLIMPDGQRFKAIKSKPLAKAA